MYINVQARDFLHKEGNANKAVEFRVNSQNDLVTQLALHFYLPI